MESSSKPDPIHALNALISAFSSQNLTASLEKKCCFKISKSLNGEWLSSEEKRFSCSSFPSSDNKVLKSFKEKVAEYIKLNPKNKSLVEYFLNLSSFLKVGDEFKTIEPLNKLFENEMKANVEHKPGEIIYIEIWASWCPYCRAPMQKITEAKEKYGSTWGDSVRIVCISLEENPDNPIKMINDNNWQNLEHYYIEKGWDPNHNLLKNFEINGVPHGILINQEGEIVWIGNPGSIQLEKKIEKLLSKEEIQISTGILKNDYKSIKDFLKLNILKEKIGKNDGKFSFALSLNKKTIYDAAGKKIKVEYERPLLAAGCTTKHENVMKDILEPIIKSFNSDILPTKLDIEDKLVDIKETLIILSLALECSNLPQIEIQFEKNTSFDFVEGKVDVNTKNIKTCKTYIDLNADSLKNIADFHNVLQEFLSKATPRQKSILENFILKTKLIVGDQFQGFEVEDAYSDQILNLSHEKEKILIVDFWATSTGPSQDSIKHYRDMFDKNNETWKDKVLKL